MRRLSRVLQVAAAMLVTPSLAHSAAEDPAWSLGAGVSLRSYSIGLLPSAGTSLSLLGATMGPSGNLLVERRLGRSWALLGSVTASYAQSSEDGTLRWLDTAFGLSAGARWITNPGGIVEVSPMVRVEASRTRTDARSGTSRTRVAGYSTSGVLGIVLERALADNLYLRLESPFLEVGYQWGDVRTRIGGTSDGYDTAGYRGALTIAPSLQLRLSF